jgi:hypothetical protein
MPRQQHDINARNLGSNISGREAFVSVLNRLTPPLFMEDFYEQIFRPHGDAWLLLFQNRKWTIGDFYSLHLSRPAGLENAGALSLDELHRLTNVDDIDYQTSCAAIRRLLEWVERCPVRDRWFHDDVVCGTLRWWCSETVRTAAPTKDRIPPYWWCSETVRTGAPTGDGSPLQWHYEAPVGDVLIPLRFELGAYLPWPNGPSREEAQERSLGNCRKKIDEYLNAAEHEWGTRKGSLYEHAVWTVLVLVGMSPADIVRDWPEVKSRRYGDPEQAVRTAVTRFAKLIGLTLIQPTNHKTR